MEHVTLTMTKCRVVLRFGKVKEGSEEVTNLAKIAMKDKPLSEVVDNLRGLKITSRCWASDWPSEILWRVMRNMESGMYICLASNQCIVLHSNYEGTGCRISQSIEKTFVSSSLL